MKAWITALVCAVAACSGKPTNGTGSGTPPMPPVANATTCDDVKPRVEQMYRAEAAAKEPARVEEAVADNTAMVMNDCATQPDRFVPCLARAATVAELEKQCLIPLDEEGSEGDAIR